MDDIKGKLMTLRAEAQRLNDGRWEAQLLAWWDQGENTFERKIPLQGSFVSQAEALRHAAAQAIPYVGMTEVPVGWLE
jgi:hypothetical protein